MLKAYAYSISLVDDFSVAREAASVKTYGTGNLKVENLGTVRRLGEGRVGLTNTRQWCTIAVITTETGVPMSDQDGSTGSGAVVLTDVPDFLDTPADLKKLLRSVSAQAKPAVEALVGLLVSKDEKIRLTAATKLLELQMMIAKEINSDNLNRLIAQVKIGNKKLFPGSDDPDKPLVDFTTVRSVE